MMSVGGGLVVYNIVNSNRRVDAMPKRTASEQECAGQFSSLKHLMRAAIESHELLNRRLRAEQRLVAATAHHMKPKRRRRRRRLVAAARRGAFEGYAKAVRRLRVLTS